MTPPPLFVIFCRCSFVSSVHPLMLSQKGIPECLGSPEGLLGTSISAYERGLREPPLVILLRYARIANIAVEALIDDDLDLP